LENWETCRILAISYSNIIERTALIGQPASEQEKKAEKEAAKFPQAIKYLLAYCTQYDIYFPDRDGQCIMHYIAKGDSLTFSDI
jgi:hypothetical protein